MKSTDYLARDVERLRPDSSSIVVSTTDLPEIEEQLASELATSGVHSDDVAAHTHSVSVNLAADAEFEKCTIRPLSETQLVRLEETATPESTRHVQRQDSREICPEPQTPVDTHPQISRSSKGREHVEMRMRNAAWDVNVVKFRCSEDAAVDHSRSPSRSAQWETEDSIPTSTLMCASGSRPKK